ncbi:MAG TPA: NADH-quinone oxidoreductase subunit C [Bacteroidales bacterium]|nr:NADH-quinone oxidoreductase subunit C [Bacteroidales bacterium]HCI54287.1 proton-conducting membrane transporter [Bacteroidales bacterium]HQG35841.1 NADH-quinone oxidoreductase subunit C [Bacteroidales bacterium]HRC89797.1 NADH-quinone oxidoreductase subunit C [Bacteroidales bacterium]
MNNEEKIKTELLQKFPYLEGKCDIIRQRRITVEVDKNNLIGLLSYLFNDLKFDYLCTITGLDIGDNLQFIYHVANKDGIVINVKTNVPKSDPVISTVTGIYNGATFYERELEDLLGARVEGLPEGRHYPLPDNWPKGQYPLRKDWKLENMNQQTKTEE